MEYIRIGKIVNTHGIKGELKIQSYSDFDAERYQKNHIVYIQSENQYIPFKVATYRNHKGMPLVSFIDHQNINNVEKYKNCDVFINKEDRKPLKNGEHYWDEFVGLTALDENGNKIGTTMHMESTNGAQNNLRIKTNDGKEILVPYIPMFIKEMNPEEKTIIIYLQEGLL